MNKAKEDRAAKRHKRAQRKALQKAYFASEKAYQELVRYHDPALQMPRIKEHQDAVFEAYQHLKKAIEAWG